MKQFLRFLAWFIPLPLFIIATNYFVDPANLFHGNYEKKISDHLAKGLNVTNVHNYNERLLQKLMAQEIHRCPEVIALGSSRVMTINSRTLNLSNFWNGGVSGAMLEDDISIFNLYEKKGCEIRKVILGIDPWILNDNNGEFRWKELKSDYYDFVNNRLNEQASISIQTRLYQYSKLTELISLSYFQSSVKSLSDGSGKNIEPTTSVINKGFTRLSDGAIYYDEAFRNATPDAVKQKALSYIDNKPVSYLGNFSNLSNHYKRLFTKFIEYMQKRGIEVELFLAPYNPIVYDFLRKDPSYRIIVEVEDYFRDFADKQRIKLRGSFDPAKLSLDSSYFFDGAHCNESAINKIFNTPE